MIFSWPPTDNIDYSLQQGTPQWHKARTQEGMITASEIGTLYQLSGSYGSRKALVEKKADIYWAPYYAEFGQTPSAYVQNMLDHGTRCEPIARILFERYIGETIEELGFVHHEGCRIGGSPDGVFQMHEGDSDETSKSVLEIKCPYTEGFSFPEEDKVHFLLHNRASAVAQLICNMVLCAAEIGFLVFYHEKSSTMEVFRVYYSSAVERIFKMFEREANRLFGHISNGCRDYSPSFGSAYMVEMLKNTDIHHLSTLHWQDGIGSPGPTLPINLSKHPK